MDPDPDPDPAPRPAPTITTVGEGTASGTPDTLRLHVSVTHRAASVSDALAGCASALDSVVAFARAFTDADRIASSGLGVHQWHAQDGTPQGYQARHSVAIVCPDLTRAGELITAVTEAVQDRLQVDHVEMFVSDTTEMLVRARAAAFADARAKADELAALAGLRVHRVVSVLEGPAGGARPYAGAEMAMAKVGTSFEPGTSTVGAAVTVTWAVSYL